MGGVQLDGTYISLQSIHGLILLLVQNSKEEQKTYLLAVWHLLLISTTVCFIMLQWLTKQITSINTYSHLKPEHLTFLIKKGRVHLSSEEKIKMKYSCNQQCYT